MNNTMIVFAVLMVGCSTGMPNNVIVSDAGFAGDGAVVSDTWVEVTDGHQDADATAQVDAGSGRDASPDAEADGGSVGGPDGGTDAAVGTTDSGTDAAVSRGDVVELGVNADSTCVLTSTHQMWCWGPGHAPAHVADAVALEGTCGIALDGHAFCWGRADLTGTDASVVDSFGSYVRRADGVLVAGVSTWTPPSAITTLPTQNCGIFADGHARCWDTFAVLVDLGAAASVSRAGSISTNTYRACVSTSTGVRCDTTRGTTGSALLQRGSRIDIAGGRACTIIEAAWSGPEDDGTGISHFHAPGVYCTSDMPRTVASGYYPFNPLAATDAVGSYTDVLGTELHVGTTHACLLRAGQVMCWGNGARGQLGGAATTRTPVAVF